MSLSLALIPNGESAPPSSTSALAKKSAPKCHRCGSTQIDVDAARGDSVCMGCGEVLEASLIVSEMQFEENAHGGGASAIGQFVSGDTKGGGMGGGGGVGMGGRMGMMGGGGMPSFGGIGRESREITLRNARNKIKALGQQLSLRQDRIDMAFNFFKMALARNLTRGRKSTHVIAACVYITCRTEGTSHMLIDFSDILQIDVYELGRTYLRLSQELCINIPAMDPCLYVMRFAHKLELDDKTHDVSMTALRLVSRMKKDWIHFGRRPSGLCGAALLIASRLHRFHRTVGDVIKVVKVHESTLRKRLNEFGETPASQLTLEEFMNIDLDAMTEEQDPPSFTAARKRDRERLAALESKGDLDDQISALETEIEKQLADKRAKLKGPYSKMAKDAAAAKAITPLDSQASGSESDGGPHDEESSDTERFITEETMGTISGIINNPADEDLMPPPTNSASAPGIVASPGLGLKDTIQEYLVAASASASSASPHLGKKEEPDEDEEDEELDLEGIDDKEIDGYLMSESEVKFKTKMWMKINADYLREKAEKEERERREEEEAIREGREPKKKKRAQKKKVNMGGNQTAIEAIEKIVQEKKISTKINYDVLRSLNMGTPNSKFGDSESAFGSPAVDTPEQIGKVFSPALNSISSPPSSAVSEKGDSVSSSRKEAVSSPPTAPVASGSGEKRKRPFGGKLEKPKPKLVSKEKPVQTRERSESESEPAVPAKKSKQLEEEQETIIESGPVEAASSSHLEEEEEELDGFDDDDMDVAQMLAKHRGEQGEEEEFYGEEEYFE